MVVCVCSSSSRFDNDLMTDFAKLLLPLLPDPKAPKRPLPPFEFPIRSEAGEKGDAFDESVLEEEGLVLLKSDSINAEFTEGDDDDDDDDDCCDSIL